MDYVRRASHKVSKGRGNHDRHGGHSVAMFRDTFWLSFALMIPLVFVDGRPTLAWVTAPAFSGSKFIPAILGTILICL